MWCVYSRWETMLLSSSVSADRLTELELRCCRRVVQLCTDCLLTIYCCATNADTVLPVTRHK